MCKSQKILLLIAILFAYISCNKSSDNISTENYLSVTDFRTKNARPLQTYIVSGLTGGRFTSPQGTIVTIPANCFVSVLGRPIIDSVKIQFNDLYKKSDMLFANITTMTLLSRPLKSAGEFFLKATLNDSVVIMSPGKKITVEQPAALTGGVDTVNKMDPYTLWIGSGIGSGAPGWARTPLDTVITLANSYVYNFFNFASPITEGTWANCDNSSLFSAYSQTHLIINPADSIERYGTELYLIFKNISTIINVFYYSTGRNFPYYYAPVGLQCTIVALGVKNGDLYSSFIPITISANQVVNLSLTKTTAPEFKAKLEALN